MSASDVARAFGLAAPARELTHVARGAMGVVYRLDTADGPYAVKRLEWAPSGDEASNIAFQFAAADAGVSLARPLLATSGDAVTELDDGWWRAYEWVDGAQIPFEAATPVEVAVAIARSVGRLHALKYAPGGAVHGWFGGVADETVEHGLATAQAAGANVDSARRALPGLAAVSRLAVPFETITCHNDLERQNVLVSATGAPSFVDWDNAGLQYAACEFATALRNWGCDGDEVPQSETIAAMTRAYRDEGGVFEPTGLEVFAPFCSAWVNYRVNCCEHLADDEGRPELVEFERAAVDDLAARCFTVAQLEQVLAAVPT